MHKQDWPTRNEALGSGQISYEGVARIVLTHRINKQERRSKRQPLSVTFKGFMLARKWRFSFLPLFSLDYTKLGQTTFLFIDTTKLS